MLVFDGWKPENPEKNTRSKDENQQQTQPTYDTRGARFSKLPVTTGPVKLFCFPF